MMYFKIAIRSIFRNGRRSFFAFLSVALGVSAIINFGQFFQSAILSIETNSVRAGGHAIIYKRGYFASGTASPQNYAIDHYHAVVDALLAHKTFGDQISVAAPFITLYGIVGNYELDRSRTFSGIGVAPEAFDAMQKWNAYRLRAQNRHIHAMSVLAPDEGVFGVGLAEVLGLCREKKTVTCKSVQLEPADADIAEDRDLDAGDPDPTLRTFLDRIAANGDKQAADETGADLLVATANGAPNIVKVRLAGIERQPSKQLDDSYVRIPFEIARGLLFGRERDASSGIAVQFKTTRAAERSLPALREFIAAQSNELELIPLSDYNSFYDQAVNFFNIIYFSVSLIMGTVVAFMIANSVTTNIFERSTEIGVVRALGMSQRSVRSVFIIEGFVLALAGAVAGVALAMAIAAAVNAAHVQIVMPGQGAAATLFLPMGGIAGILSARVVASAIIVAGVASYLSSRYIGALDILSALRRI